MTLITHKNHFEIILVVSPKDEDFSEMFSTFFNNSSRMASTYKPVFLRALLDIGDLVDSKKDKEIIGEKWLEKKDDRLLIDLNFIAIRFVKFYWDMEYSFHLRQSQDLQDANIIRIIREKHDPRKKPPTIKELASEDMTEFRKTVITKSMRREVIVHLKTDMDNLYQKINSNTLSVDLDLIDFLHIHKTTLKFGLNYVISKYLEKINHNIPRITTKVECDLDRPSRTTLNKETQLKMEKLQKNVCFYCKKEMNRYHVDHVIPFNFVFSTEPYNCVLACQECNCTKSDLLPIESIFCDDVLVRNRANIEILNNKWSSYDEQKYHTLYNSCKVEYNGDKFFHPCI